MDNKERNKRVSRLIAKLNKERKAQSQKIDILCNDIIAAHKEFINNLNTICFTANFYESIIGQTDLNELLYGTSETIKAEIPKANVAFFLRQKDGFEMQLFESDQPTSFEKHHLQQCFTPGLIENICKSNKVCSLDELLVMGLQTSPACLNKIRAVTFPLTRTGTCHGFILIYYSSEICLTDLQTKKISSMLSGLTRSITSCQLLSSSVS